MSRWLLALLFAFGSVTLITGCEEKAADPADAADEAVEEGEAAADEAAGEGEAAADEAAGE